MDRWYMASERIRITREIKMKPIILTISMLVSNRKDTIRRALDSLKPIMEQIPSELILVDTSTDPEVPQILKEYTDNIIKFQWINDFSAARNVGLEAAKGEWFLFLDDDEWFVEIDELVKFFQSGEYKQYGCANYMVRNFIDQGWTAYSEGWVSRMIKIEPDTRFKSKIHEYLEPVHGDCKMIKAVVNHTGYIAVTEEDRLKRYERNSVLLREMVAEEPEKLRWRVQLAQEYRAVCKWNELLDFCVENLEYTKDWKKQEDYQDIGTFYAGAIESYFVLGKYQEAKEVGTTALNDKRMNELCQAYMVLRLAMIAVKEKNWDEAHKQVEAYFVIGEHLKKNEIRYANQSGALIVGAAFEAIEEKKAYSIRCICGLKNKDSAPLKKYLDKLEWNQKVIYVYMDIIPVLFEAMATMPYEEVFVEALQYLWNNQELQKQLFVEVASRELEKPEEFRHLLPIVSSVEGNHWYLCYVKILMADYEKNGDKLEYLFEEYYKNAINIFTTPENLMEIAKKNEISIEEQYKKIPFSKWEQNLREYVSKAVKEDLLVTEKEMLRLVSNEDIRFDYFFIRVSEAKVLYSAFEKEYKKKEAAFLEFAQRTVAFLEKYYNQDIILNYPELLPAYGQAAIIIAEAFCLKEEEPTAMLAKMRQVVDIYETFAEPVKKLICSYGEEQERLHQQREDEMRKLEVQILQQVRNCVAKQEYEQALLILAQLKNMKPNDLELISLSLEIRLMQLSQS